MALAVLSVVVFTAVAVLCAVIEVTLVPLRYGSTVLPVTVLLAVASNIAVPTLSRRAVPLTVAALLPAVAWIATVILLSQARPEGDVLLIGTAPLVDVTYALLGIGVISALGTVIRGQHSGPLTAPVVPPAVRPVDTRSANAKPADTKAADTKPVEAPVSSGRTDPPRAPKPRAPRPKGRSKRR